MILVIQLFFSWLVTQVWSFWLALAVRKILLSYTIDFVVNNLDFSNNCFRRTYFEPVTHYGDCITVHMLGGLLACVPAHSDDSSDLEHHALPSIKLTLDWIVSNVSSLRRPEVAQNSR